KLGGNVKTTETSDFGGELTDFFGEVTEAFGQFYEKNVFVNADAVLTDGAFGANLDATGKLVIEGNMKISGNLGTFAAPASVFVGGSADFSSGSAQKVITAGKQTYSKNITALSKLEITAGGTAESESYVVLHGFDAEASLLLTAETAELFYADYVSEGEQVFDCQTVKISANSENSLSSCQWAAKSADSKITLQKENSRLFFDFGKEGENRELALKTDLSSADVFAYSGKITLSGEVTVSARNFTAWGKNYSAVDRCFSESNSRFAYFGDEALLTHSTAAEIGVSGEGTGEKVIEVSENFYVNGLDLQNLTLKIPDNSSSNPVFNSTAQVTERQWGLPYAVAFNSTISGTKAENGWLTASSYAQNCVDGGENSQVQFQSPKIQKAYSVYDDVVYVEFDMAVENSKGEVSSIFAQNYESAASGGVWYFGGTVQFEGVYSDPDCTTRLLEEDVKGFYLKGGTSWNTDATGSAPYSTALKAERDSTDRKGVHKTVTTDLSFLEGCFFAAEGKTFCQNYGAGTDRDTGSLPPAYTQTEDRSAPVLIAFYTGQELHTPGKSSEQKTYDSHNFMEFWYSEAVDIGELKYDGGDTNVRAVSGTGHISGNGTLTENNSGQTGLAIEGLASIDDGILLAFSKDGTDSPHALYRKFSTKAGEEEQIQTHRVRVGVAAFTDGTVTFTDSQNPALNGQYHNWLGCIKKAQTPKGTVAPVENSRITDIFGNVLDAAARNEGDAHRLPDLTVNSHTDGLGIKDSEQTGSLYGEWDVLPPVIAPIVSSRNGWNRWSLGSEAGGLDSPETSEIIGSSESTSDNTIKYIEVHFFDNDRTQAEIWSEIWWRTRKGWITDLGDTSALPESRGGARPESSDSKTSGGIRLCSLKNENRSFSYKVKDMQTGSFSGAGEQYFDGATDISPTVFSTVFKPKDRTTSADGLYIRLPLKDTSLSVRTIFELAYNPEESYVTDLAGNLLSSSYPQKTCFDSLDLTPPSIILTLAPIGENKIYAVFSKQLDLTGSSTDSTGTATDATDSASGASVSDTLLAQIAESFVLVQKGSASGTAPEENAVVRAEYVSSSENYTALLFTLEKSIDLSDVENLWLRNTGWNSQTTEDLLGLTVADTKIRDSLGNYMNVNTGHTLSDFAVNALDVLYAYANQKNSDGWDEKSLYGENLAPASGDYAVHDFTAEQGNYGTLLENRDITLQVKTAGEMPSDRKFILLPAKKSSLETGMVSDRINALLGTDWRLWLPTPQKTLATTPNTAILAEISPENAGLSENSDSTLWNYTFYDEKCSFKSGDEIQFLFKLAKADGTDVTIDSDADNFDGASSPSEEIPLYGVKMPLEKIQAGDFSFVDLWSFKLKGIKQQRGGVTILNNVINVNLREQTVVEVNVPEAGNLNVFVMTLDGNIVRRLNHGRVQAGTRYYRWDGTNAAGKPVARGLYFVRVVGPQIDETRKVLCVKE
uniref:FlgD immunoglobulin-like domain containing protein n=1 Tax=uncultured Treponema sp. TaxID=162155 RepID=UPI0015BB878D